MYCPAHFHVSSPAELAGLIEQFPLATIIREDDSGLTADHIPLMYKPAQAGLGELVGHVSRNNPLWQASPQQELLVVFQGPSTYISPNWYASKRETGKVVPTWNYAVVHAHCTLRAELEPSKVMSIITELTEQHEAEQEHPWQVTDAPVDFTDRLINNIVGVSLQINRWQGKWKVSQNQPVQNQLSVVEGLLGEASDAQTQMALLVKSHGST